MYALGACPTIYVGDSGELVAAVHQLGIPHPSGYPLYVILGKLWTLLVPLGTIAFRMSLFSAACAAAAAGVLHWLCHRLGLHPVAAAFSALLLAFSASYWGEANVQRVYSLNALFIAAATAAAFAWYRSRDSRPWLLAWFLCGLGATNHTFMAVYGVALGLFSLSVAPGFLRRPRTLSLAAVAFVVGLLPYLYLPLRSRANPPLDWGNPENLQNLLAVVLRRGFWDRAFVESPRDLLPIGADYFRSLGAELLWVGAALGLLGIPAGRRRGWPVLLPLLVMAVNLAAVSAHGSRTDLFVWHRYYIPSYLMAALLAGVGCHALLERLSPRLRFLPLALPVLAGLTNARELDRSRYRIADDFSRTLLQTLPPGAHLSANDDNILFVLIYLHHVESLRPDVDLILEGVGGESLPPLRFDPDRDPLFLTHHPNWSAPGLDVVPVGLVFKTLRSGRPLPPAIVPKGELAGERDPRVPKDYLTRNLIGHFHFMLGCTFENRDWPRAARELKAAEESAPDNDVLFYNLGLVYRRNGLFEEAHTAFRRSHEINPRHMASTGRARAWDRVREVRAELGRLRAIEATLGPGLAALGIAPGTTVYHRRMAELLDERGETLAARGHGLRALMQGPSPR